jgi:hypothetical protein
LAHFGQLRADQFLGFGFLVGEILLTAPQNKGREGSYSQQGMDWTHRGGLYPLTP